MSIFQPSSHPAVRRRHWLTEPGEPLLAPNEPLTIVGRFLEFTRTTGISPAALSMSRVGAVPVPAPDSPGGGPRAFHGLSADHLWHPLFWLPEHLTRRVMIQESDTSARSETDDEWVARVLLVLELAGVYDVEDGWIDMLAAHDLNLDQPPVRTRIQKWLEGADDEVLTNISVEQYLPSEPFLDWSVAVSGAVVDRSLPSVWAISADSLIDLIDEAVEDETDARSVCHQVTSLARFAFRDMPDDNGILGIFDMLSLDPESIVDPALTLASLRTDIDAIRARFIGELDVDLDLPRMALEG